MSQVIEPPLMHPVAGALVVLDEAFDGAIGADLWQLTDAELLEAARELHRQQCRSEALQLALVREIDQRGAAVALGAPSTKAWLRSGLRMHPGAAKRLAATATALHSDPAGPLTSYEEDAEADDVPPRVRGLAASREALAAGAISAEHVSVIAEALAALPPEVGRSTIAEGEAVLAHYAREHDPAELGKLGKRLLHRLDPNCGDRLAQDELTCVEQRELFIVPRRGGGYAVKGVLDDELGAAWLAVLSPYAAPRPADDVTGGDPRSPAHRTADALADLIRLATSHPDVTSVHGSKPTVVVTLDYATLTRQLRANAAALDWAGPVSAEAARRLACDAGIVAMVLGADGQPLDVGRLSYTVTTAIRRALTGRDQGCAYPGCECPPVWTNAHHIVHWADGGSTSLANLVHR